MELLDDKQVSAISLRCISNINEVCKNMNEVDYLKTIELISKKLKIQYERFKEIEHIE